MTIRLKCSKQFDQQEGDKVKLLIKAQTRSNEYSLLNNNNVSLINYTITVIIALSN